MRKRSIVAALLACLFLVTACAPASSQEQGTPSDDPAVPADPTVPTDPSDEKKSVTLSQDNVSVFCGESILLTAQAEGGTLAWKIEGDHMGCSIDRAGEFVAGDKEGEVVVTAYLQEDPAIAQSCIVRVAESMLASATALGTSHNNIVTHSDFTYTFRTYFEVREYGEFDYSFYYDNRLDSTWWSEPSATADRKGSEFEILSAYFADGGTAADGSVEEGTSVAVTFDGQTSRVVEEGETFSSDEVAFNVPEGHLLAFTWTLKVDAQTADGATIPFTDTANSFATCYKKNGDHAAQESAAGFLNGDSEFGTNVLIAPNKICYRREKGRELVFVGDSITQGVSTMSDAYEFWVARVAEMLPNDLSVWNLGSGWATAGNFASEGGVWSSKVANADELFLCLGVNDIGGNITLEAYQEHIATIVARVRSLNPDCTISMFTVPPFNYESELGEVWFEINEWIASKSIEGVDRYFDFAAVLSKSFPEENYLKDVYMSSETDAHPNGLAGEAIAQSFVRWYDASDSEAVEAYDTYLNVDVGETLVLPSFVPVMTAGGWYDRRAVTWDRQASTDAVGVTQYTGSIEGSSLKVTYTVRVRDLYPYDHLYYVICGNSTQVTETGTSNSVYDREFGADAATGKSWGHVEQDGGVAYTTAAFWNDYPIWQAVRAAQTMNGMLYRFELDAGTYTISLGLKDPWSTPRTIALSIDGVPMGEMAHNGSEQTSKQFTFEVASNKFVDVLLTETTNQLAALSWISIDRTDGIGCSDLTAKSGNTFVQLEWTSAFGATEYEIGYGTHAGDRTQTMTVGGTSAHLKELTNGQAYYIAVRAKNKTSAGEWSNEVCVTPQACDDENVLYRVDCGNLFVYDLGTRAGVYQSSADRAYGEDPVTGRKWGYTTDGTPWADGTTRIAPQYSALVANLGTEKEGKGIDYRFEVEDGTYTVEISFFDYWRSPQRVMDIMIGGECVMEGYRYSGYGKVQTFTFEATVSGGELQVQIVGGEGNADNILVNEIVVRK